MSELDEYILELAEFSSVAWTLQTEQDKQNLCEFVKNFALIALNDSVVQQQLFKGPK